MGVARRILGRSTRIGLYDHVCVWRDGGNAQEEWLIVIFKRLVEEVVCFVRRDVGGVLAFVADRLLPVPREMGILIFVRIYKSYLSAAITE